MKFHRKEFSPPFEEQEKLTGHVVYSFQVDRLSSCLIPCNIDPTCQGVNFNRISKVCDFNNETKYSRPADFLANEAYIYVNNMDRAKKGSIEGVPGRSCKDIKESGDFTTSGQYWIKPVEASEAFQGFCDMAGVGGWIKVTKAWIKRTINDGVTITHTEENGGLVISGQVTNNGCGGGRTGSGFITFINGYWTRIKFKQEFRGVVSCWRIFGNSDYNAWGKEVGRTPHGIHNLNVSQGDSITNEYNMGGSHGNKFDGKTLRCDNQVSNFWDYTRYSVRSAEVVLRRVRTAEEAGLFTSTSCGKPSYTIRDIFVSFG